MNSVAAAPLTSCRGEATVAAPDGASCRAEAEREGEHVSRETRKKHHVCCCTNRQRLAAPYARGGRQTGHINSLRERGRGTRRARLLYGRQRLISRAGNASSEGRIYGGGLLSLSPEDAMRTRIVHDRLVVNLGHNYQQHPCVSYVRTSSPSSTTI